MFGIYDLPPHAIRDANGNIAGPDVDLVKAVCKEAGKKCDFVFGRATDCMQSDDRTGNNIFGPALQRGLIDACPMWFNSKIRQTFYDFTTLYAQATFLPPRLIVRSEDALGFNPVGKTIILSRTQVTDAYCFR